MLTLLKDDVNEGKYRELCCLHLFDDLVKRGNSWVFLRPTLGTTAVQQETS